MVSPPNHVCRPQTVAGTLRVPSALIEQRSTRTPEHPDDEPSRTCPGCMFPGWPGDARHRGARALAAAGRPATTKPPPPRPSRRLTTSPIARRSRWPSRPTATGLLTANQTAGTVSLVDTKTGKRAARAQDRRQARGRGALAGRPSRRGHPLVRLRPGVLDIKDDRIAVCRPRRGRARAPRRRLTADGSTAYVAVGVSNEVVRVDRERRRR